MMPIDIFLEELGVERIGVLKARQPNLGNVARAFPGLPDLNDDEMKLNRYRDIEHNSPRF